MTKVDNFRSYNLYKRSIDLTSISYNIIHSCKNNLTEAEVALIRKKVVTLSIKIASAIAQVKMAIRFKKLNEAKFALIQLQSAMRVLKRKNKIDEYLWHEIENCSTEIMKLLHGYFGWISKSKCKTE